MQKPQKPNNRSLLLIKTKQSAFNVCSIGLQFHQLTNHHPSLMNHGFPQRKFSAPPNKYLWRSILCTRIGWRPFRNFFHWPLSIWREIGRVVYRRRLQTVTCQLTGKVCHSVAAAAGTDPPSCSLGTVKFWARLRLMSFRKVAELPQISVLHS